MIFLAPRRPGLYAHMEKDGQLTAKAYSYVEREAGRSHILLQSAFWVDDFPNFPFGGMR